MKLKRFLLRSLVRLYPRSTRELIGDELLDALDDSLRSSGWRLAARESAGLVVGAAGSWRSYLMTATSVHAGLVLGLSAWWGFLVGLGPGRRAVTHWLEPGQMSYSQQVEPWLLAVSAIAVVFLVAVPVTKSKIAVMLLLTGAGLAAVSNKLSWEGLLELVLYEIRWLVPIGGAMFLLRRGARRMTLLPIVLPMFVASLGGIGAPWAGRNYGLALWELSPDGIPLGVLVVGLAIILLGPLLSPGAMAPFIPAIGHLGLMGLAAFLRQGTIRPVNDPILAVLAVWLIVAVSARLYIGQRRALR